MLNDLETAATALLGEVAVATNKKQTEKENNNMTNNTTSVEEKVEAFYQQIRTKADLKNVNNTMTEEEYIKACEQVIFENPDTQKTILELSKDPEALALILENVPEEYLPLTEFTCIGTIDDLDGELYDIEDFLTCSDSEVSPEVKDQIRAVLTQMENASNQEYTQSAIEPAMEQILEENNTTQTEKGNENMTNNNTAVEEVVAVEVEVATATTAATTQATEELGFFGKVKAKLKSYVTAIKDKYKSFKAAVKEDGFFSAVKAQAKALASAKYSGKAIISQAMLAGSTLIATLLAPVSFTMTGFFVSYAMYHAAASVLTSLFTDRSAKDVLKDIAIFGIAMPVVAYASFTVSLFTAAAIL